MDGQQTLLDMNALCEAPPRLTRQQLVDSILELNPTATSGFLMGFTDDSLQRYLEHLSLGHGPRGKGTSWLRETGRPGIVGRENLW